MRLTSTPNPFSSGPSSLIRVYVGMICLIASPFVSANIGLANEDAKRPLEHSDYEIWSAIQGHRISGDGKWVMYSIDNRKQQNPLVIRSTRSTKEYLIRHGSGGAFTDDSQFAIYNINPDPDVVKKLRKQKQKDLPTRRLEVLHLETGSNQLIHRVKSFSIPENNSDWLGVLLLAPPEAETVKAQEAALDEKFEITEYGLQRPQAEWKWAKPKTRPEAGKKTEATAKPSESQETEPTAAKESSSESKQDPDKSKKEKENGTVLILHNLKTKVEQRFPNVTSFVFSKHGEVLLFASSGKEPEDDGVTLIDLRNGAVKPVISGRGNYRQLTTNLDGSQIAFLSERDDYESEQPSWSLYHATKSQKGAKRIAHEGDSGIPNGWWVAATGNVIFSEDNRRLYFATRPKPEELNGDKSKDEAEDTDEEDKVELDIWHWQDPLLQPQQLVQKEQELRRSYAALFDLRSKKIVQLASPEIPSVQIDSRSKSDWTVANSNERYRKELSWDIPGFQDSYLINLRNGSSDLINERVKFSTQLSPEGKYLYWYDAEEQHWFGMTVKDRAPRKLSAGISAPLYNELHDTPSLPGSYGTAGWLEGDKGLLIYDRYDIWQLDPDGDAPPICLTASIGRENSLRLRYLRLDSEQRAIDPKQPMILSAFDEESNASGFYSLSVGTDRNPTSPSPLIVLDERLTDLRKAKYTEDVILTRQTFRRFPDLWHSTTSFDEIARLTRANPQQDQFIWGTAEKVSWNSTTGEALNGLLYKPDDFDPSRKYPLLVYFYERNSDNLHQYHIPAAGRSVISYSFYVSRGYVLFVPDIPYRTGEPGPSAADAILPGVQSIVDLGFIDEQKIGVQGHSWGGYQIAYLVTQTNVFACAESGAPVSNMTSAYGGIRWGTGMSRMFQYERTQSRIGETLWEARDKYIANSPLFFADQIETPLLILHNDEDTAVPWYQGIELFVALRRLSKPAWMLNYNGDPHWVMSEANRLDFATRMQQFFDHYLKDAPMPVWMAKGIPAVDKGKKFGFEYVPPAD